MCAMAKENKALVKPLTKVSDSFKSLWLFYFRQLQQRLVTDDHFTSAEVSPTPPSHNLKNKQ